MRELIDELTDIEVVIFDLDGVVYRTSEIIPNADKIIKELKDHGKKVVYNSNNSTITREMYVERLDHFGIESKVEDFYTSAYITASEITRVKPNSKAFIIGEIGIKEELEQQGHHVIKKPKDYGEIDFVVVGLDLHFRYSKLGTGLNCLMEGNAKFYATNDDATLPSHDGIMPGAGTMVKALETCAGRPPDIVMGKPNPFGIEQILRNLNVAPEKACIIGDRMETDIIAGNRAGIKTIAVLTGITRREMIDELLQHSREDDEFDEDLLPHLVIDTLDDLFKK